MSIRLLSEETINKIAAGEVIERPANVVKELVENSIDAGSTAIEIEIKGAGRHLIRVRDNGGGMTREDMCLSVMRHATSKIAGFSDLDTLHSLGFRGEALPSIASVSHLLMQSRPHDAPDGWEIALAGGKETVSKAWAGAPGTTIEVSRLFFNTPAREKFLKSDITERNRIIHIIEELSLAWPNVAFRIVSEGKTILDAPRASTDMERFFDVLGKDFASTLAPVSVDHPSLTLRAYITKRDKSLSSRGFQYLFLNRRPVNLGKIVMHALYEAYRENLPAGRHPGAVIFLELDPSTIDVNIHPTKREVRFSREQETHQFLVHAFRGTLQNIPFESIPVPTEEPVPPPTPLTFKENLPGEYGRHTPSFPAAQNFPVNTLKQPAPPPRGLELEEEPRTIGQAFGLYIVAQFRDELFIIDQHAAAERVRYEAYKAQFEKREIPVQGLLIPVTMELPPSRAGLLRENLPLLAAAGWEAGEFGMRTIRITALPAVLGASAQAADILHEILQALTDEGPLPTEQKIDVVIRAACRSSIKANEHISPEESLRLIKDLFRCTSPYTCPHGRPTAFTIARHELERYFGRK